MESGSSGDGSRESHDTPSRLTKACRPAFRDAEDLQKHVTFFGDRRTSAAARSPVDSIATWRPIATSASRRANRPAVLHHRTPAIPTVDTGAMRQAGFTILAAENEAWPTHDVPAGMARSHRQGNVRKSIFYKSLSWNIESLSPSAGTRRTGDIAISGQGLACGFNDAPSAPASACGTPSQGVARMPLTASPRDSARQRGRRRRAWGARGQMIPVQGDGATF